MIIAIILILFAVALFLIFHDDHDDSYTRSDKRPGRESGQKSVYQKSAEPKRTSATPKPAPVMEPRTIVPKEKEYRPKKLDERFKPAPAERIMNTASLSVSTLSRWFGYQCREALIMGLMTAGGMLILRMPYAAPMACLAALMQMIPFVGGWITFIVGSLTMLTVNPHSAAVFAVMTFTFQQVEGMLINPHLVGTKVGLSPYLSLSAVIVGSALYGPVGMFLAVPICSVLYTLGREFLRRREESRTEDAEP